MGKVELVRFETPDELARVVADRWLEELTATPRPYCAFSGGRIAEKFFDALTARSCGRESEADLNNVHFFCADERCVPPDHPESNYRLMHTRVLKPLKIADAQVHRIKGEIESVSAAEEASRELKLATDSRPRLRGVPVLDFVFLGMGEDGHVASIFPGDETVEWPDGLYRAVVAPKPPPQRITLGMHVILAAHHVWVLASGSGKEQALGKSLGGDGDLPLGRVIRGREFTNVFTDIRAK